MLAHLKTILYVVLQRYIWSVISENIALGKTCYQRSRQLLNLAKLVLLVVGPERGVGVLTGDLVLLDQVLAGPGHLPHLRLAQGEVAGGRERTGVERHLE